MNIKRLVKLSVILVLCLFATGVANAETYDGECYYETIVDRMYVKSATITYMDGSKKTVSIRKSFNYSMKDADKYYKYI